MPATKANNTTDFLNGGGEMGALMRAYDWSSSPLGPPSGWPTALRVALRLLLTSNHPMFIWWGPELIQFYNDAYRQTMGPEHHPGALGQRGQECWREAWHIVGSEVDHVMSGRGATWHEDHLVPVTRHGRLQDAWWTYGYSPIEDEHGIGGVLVICNDVTNEHLNRDRLQHRNEQLGDEVAVRRGTEAELVLQRDSINLALDKSQGELARQLGDWQELHAMTSQLLRTVNVKEQFDVVLGTVARFHNTQKGVISCFDPKLNGLVTATSLGLDDKGLRDLACVPLGSGACGTAFQRRQRIIVADTETDPLYAQYRGFAREQGIRALYSTPFFAASGEPLGVLSVYFAETKTPDARELQLTDICAGQIGLFVERERAERRLHVEQQRSHRVLQTLRDGFALMDHEFRILQINAAGLAIDGRPESDILGRTHWEAWPGSDLEPIGQAYKRVMRERTPLSLQYQYELNGRHLWFDAYVYPYDDGIAVMYRDITEQKVTEQTLAAVRSESEQRFRLFETILSNSLDLAYVFDLEHRFTYANQILLRMWNKTWEESIGKTCLELGYEPWHAQMHGEEIERVKATKLPIRGEVPFAGVLGRRMYEYIFVPVLGPDGNVEAVAGTTRDITDRKRIEEELQRLAADLAESNRRKTEFLATLAHELRNPLAPIRTGLDLMRMQQHASPTLVKALGMMDRQMAQLVRLIDDLMDLSRIDSGKIVLKKERVELQTIVSDAIETVLPLIESAHHRFDIAIPPEPVYLDADACRLAQVLGNLLTNAAKYTPAGGQISLRAHLAGPAVRLTVSDNGIGIPAEALPQVFDIFSQVSKNIGRAQGGLGIGLALVRSLVAMHGGSVFARSEGDGKGSEFTVELPLCCADDAPAGAPGQRTAAAHTTVPRKRVLVADDNEDASSMLAALFEILGHRVDTARDGPEALEMAAAHTYDLIILDIGMPGLTGYEVVSRMRAISHLHAATFVALTGWGAEGDRERARAAGFDRHLTKPAGMEAINSLLAALPA